MSPRASARVVVPVIAALQRENPLLSVDLMVVIDALDVARSGLPAMVDRFRSTSVQVQVEDTRDGLGIGLLPCSLADELLI